MSTAAPAAAEKRSSAYEVRWDLSPLYSGLDDGTVAADRRSLDERVKAFTKNRGRAAEADAASLRAMILELEEIDSAIERLRAFAQLLACTDEDDAKKVAFREEVDEQVSRWAADILFFDVELRRLPPERLDALAADPALASWRHWIRRKKAFARYTLSEPEERVITKKNIAGRDALVRFREEFAPKMDFGELEIDGVRRKVTESDLRSLGEHRDPALRAAASDRVYETYRRNEDVFAFVTKSVVKDYGIEAELRGYARPIDVENVANEVPGEVVSALVEATRRRLPLAHDYYAWKGRVLGLPRMRTCDRVAPVAKLETGPIEWHDGRRMVERCLDAFDPEFASLGRRFFDERRIDASVHRGKRGGGFCYPVPGHDPWILLNYTDTIDPVFTLAHEVGHGVHFQLSRRAQKPLQAFSMSKVVAETASEFNESLLIDLLLAESRDDDLKVHVLAHACDGFLKTVYRQVMFTEFELAAHEESRAHALTPDLLRSKWERLARDYYGPHVDLMRDEAWGYSTVPHFVFNPFYCYSYALSQVVVLSLYERWKRVGSAEFVPGYRRLLAGGASGTCEELLGPAGVDLRDPATLERAFDAFAARFEVLRKLLPG